MTIVKTLMTTSIKRCKKLITFFENFFAMIFQRCHILLLYDNIEARNIRVNIVKRSFVTFCLLRKDIFVIMNQDVINIQTNKYYIFVIHFEI